MNFEHSPQILASEEKATTSTTTTMKSVTVDDSGDVYDGSEGNDRDDVGGPDQHEAGAVGLLTSDSLSMDGLLFPILTKCY